MSRPWYRFLETLGRLRIPIRFGVGRAAGDPSATDAQGGRGWAAYARSEPLFQVWGPLEGSPWEPYHAVPLFASLDWADRRRVGPTPAAVLEEEAKRREEGGGGERPLPGSTPAPAPSPPPPPPVRPRGFRRQPTEPLPSTAGFLLPEHARPDAPPPAWLEPGTLCVLDLPGRSTVEAAVWLVTGAGAQPVCTFDHWPHARGVLPADQLLAELLRWATTVASARGRIPSDAPPLFICDAARLGTRKGQVGEFDNRYFLDDSILPTPRVLAGAGIQRVVYLGWAGGEDSPDAPEPGPHVPLPDLVEWFAELLTAGIELFHVPVADPELRLRPFQAPARRPRFSRKGFRRSAAGGFGVEVPDHSSSGSSG